jgi:hypothetical protein
MTPTQTGLLAVNEVLVKDQFLRPLDRASDLNNSNYPKALLLEPLHPKL